MKIGLAIGAALLAVAILAGPESKPADDHGRPPARRADSGTAPGAVARGGAQTPEPRFRKLPGLENWTMIANSKMAPQAYKAAAQTHCRGKTFCSVHAWSDGTKAASTLPMSASEAAAQAYSYSLNRSTNFEQSLWNCAMFPKMADKEGSRCLATGD
ncbi:MAG TPA: hypothetical protein VF759_02030 [Allosphingosinicella sp.]